MVFVIPKDTHQIQDKFVQWLNDNLDDPYEQRKKLSRTIFVFGEDFKLTSTLPLIHFSAGDYIPNKINTQGKTDRSRGKRKNSLRLWVSKK